MGDYCKVLIIDDEQLLRQGLKYLINWNEEGYDIVGEAGNGEIGLQMIEEKKPDIVLTDIVMPVMNGMALTKIIKEKYPDIIIIVLSSYNKFEYVKTTFKNGVEDYILKPTLGPEELLNTLNSARKKLNRSRQPKGMDKMESKETIINKILREDRVVKEDIDFLKEAYSFECYIMGCCRISQKPYGDALHLHMENQSNSTYRILSLTNGDYYIFIIGYNKKNEVFVSKWIKENLHNVRTQNNNCYFAISPAFSKLKKLLEIYQGLCQGLHYQYYLPEVLYLAIYDRDREISQFPNKAFNKEVALLNINKAYEILHHFIMSVVKSLCLEPYDLKRQCQSAIYTIISEMDNMALDISQLNRWKLSCFRDIDNTSNVKELYAVVRDGFDKLDQFLKEHSMLSNAIIKKVVQYIEDNYNQQIQLSDVAEALFLNYSYLSHYFNHHFKMTFNDYLNAIRIKKAMALLKSSSKSIAQISEVVGYSDQSYFGKVFKKINGITPSDYRNKRGLSASMGSMKEFSL